MKVWHVIDAPEHAFSTGIIYLHHEVEDFMDEIVRALPEDEWAAPDLACTDAAGLTTFIAKWGLEELSFSAVEPQGRLVDYPNPLVFVGFATRREFLRIRGLVVDVIRLEQTIDHVKSKMYKGEYGVDAIL
jgi:hypothetical protein